MLLLLMMMMQCLLDSKKDDKVAVPVCAQEHERYYPTPPHPTGNWTRMSSFCVCWTARKIMTLTGPTPSPEGSVCTTETLFCAQVSQNPVCAAESILCVQVSRLPDINPRFFWISFWQSGNLRWKIMRCSSLQRWLPSLCPSSSSSWSSGSVPWRGARCKGSVTHTLCVLVYSQCKLHV